MKIDLKRCFDNIPHKELMEGIKEENYNFIEYKILRKNIYNNRIEIKYDRISRDVIYPIHKQQNDRIRKRYYKIERRKY